MCELPFKSLNKLFLIAGMNLKTPEGVLRKILKNNNFYPIVQKININ